MLRIFRLDPKFELEPCPVNTMYIDIESEYEIKERYIKKKDTELEFSRRTQWEEKDIFMGNYLVLKEKPVDCEPIISDIDIVRKVPGFNLPPTFALGIEDLMASIMKTNVESITEPFIAEKPSEFIISIRSIHSDAEKLTVDQNEALMCGFAYYYPEPPPRIMVFEKSTGLYPEGFVPKIPGQKRLRTIDYKGHEFVPDAMPKALMDNARMIAYQVGLMPSISYLYFVRHSDDDIRCKTLFSGDHKRKVSVDINELPPPLHSDYLILNFVNKDPSTLHISSSTRFLIERALKQPKLFLKGPYKNAVVPCLEQFELLSESICSE